MIVQCDSCHAKYRIKDEKISDKGAKVKCSKCKNYFIVKKDQPPVSATPAPTATAPAPEPTPAVAAPPAPETPADDGGYGIDFEPEAPQAEASQVPAPAPVPPVEAPAAPPVEVPAPAPEAVVEAPVPSVEAPQVEAPAVPPVEADDETSSYGEISFGADAATSAETPADESAPSVDDGGWSSTSESSAPIMSDDGEDDSWGSSEDNSWGASDDSADADTASEAPSFGEEEDSTDQGFGGFGFEEETAVGSDTTSAPDEGPSFGGFGGGGGFEVEVDGDNSAGGEETVIFSVGGAGSEDSGMGLATSDGGGSSGVGEETVFGGFGMADDDEAETQVEDSGAGEEAESDAPDEDDGKKKKKKKEKKKKKKKESSGEPRSKRLLVVLFIIVLLGGGGYAYTQGFLDELLGSFSKTAVPDKDAVEIIAMKGVFVENENFGTVFALEAKLRNHTEDDQRIQVIKGTIYDKNGKALKYKKVSPGRIVSREQLKTLGKADINRHFKNVSGGNISPLGTLPVMIVFMDVPSDMAEAGIEVVR